MERLLPELSAGTLQHSAPRRVPAQGQARRRVGLLVGCVQRVFFPHVNDATARVLAADGCEVHAPRGQGCCGALALHAGEPERAKAFARDLITTFERTGVELVAVYGLDLGIAGSAWSTVLVQVLAAGAYLLLMRPHLRAVGSHRPDRAELSRLLRAGAHLVVRVLSLIAAFAVATAVAARVDTTTVAAHQVVNTMFTLLALSLDAFAIPAQTLVAEAFYAYGGRPDGTDRVTAQGVAGYQGKSFRLAAQYLYQKRKSGTAQPDVEIDVWSGFAVWQVKPDKAALFARLDSVRTTTGGVEAGLPEADSIDYLALSPDAPFRAFIGGFEYALHPSVRLAPNVEWIRYDDFVPAVSSDVVLRLTFFWSW